MPRVLTMICVFALGCYDDPDYTGTHFKCDSTHACPDGQSCVTGRCSGGSDAAVQTGVACGSQTCTTGQKCCADFISAAQCTAVAVACAGREATCDGAEDCSGNPCCDPGGTLPIACGTTCQSQICREPADCTNAGSMACCFGVGTPNEPWGRCLPACP